MWIVVAFLFSISPNYYLHVVFIFLKEEENSAEEDKKCTRGAPRSLMYHGDDGGRGAKKRFSCRCVEYCENSQSKLDAFRWIASTENVSTENVSNKNISLRDLERRFNVNPYLDFIRYTNLHEYYQWRKTAKKC